MKKKSNTGSKVYRVFSVIVITLLAIGFAFPLYWIITGSFKTSMAINAPTLSGGPRNGFPPTIRSFSADRPHRYGKSEFLLLANPLQAR